MKKRLSKYLKVGIGILTPFILVFMVLSWLYNSVSGVVIKLLPSTLSYEWWYVFVFIVGILIVILLLGVMFSQFKLVKWFKKKIDKLINRVPLLNKIYNFGLELADSFLADTKDDGEIIIVEVETAMGKMLGMLTDPINNIITIPTTPNPTNGFLIQREDYKVVDLTIGEFLKIVGSMGKLGGVRWK